MDFKQNTGILYSHYGTTYNSENKLSIVKLSDMNKPIKYKKQVSEDHLLYYTLLVKF